MGSSAAAKCPALRPASAAHLRRGGKEEKEGGREPALRPSSAAAKCPALHTQRLSSAAVPGAAQRPSSAVVIGLRHRGTAPAICIGTGHLPLARSSLVAST